MTAPRYGNGTIKDLVKTKEIPPTEVGGLFRSNLHNVLPNLQNPTNGSWWIVQIRPPKQAAKRIQKRVQFHVPFSVDQQVGSEQSTNFRWWDFQFNAFAGCRSAFSI